MRLASYARRRRPPPAMPTTTSPPKRPSAGARLRRLLASLRPPARAGPLPVQTGFPTSLADLVVKNHGRLKKPRRRHRATTSSPPPVSAAAAEPEHQQRRELSAAQQDAAVPAPPPSARPNGAGFTVRPELLAVGGLMALALLVIWSKRLVLAATLASVALLWIESVRSPAASRRRPRPETEEDESNSRGRGLVSPIRESPAETPRPSCAAASDASSDVSSLWAADTTDEVAGDDPGSTSPNNRKEKRRSLRKLLAKKLQNGKKPKDGKDSRHGGESGHPGGGGEASAPEPAVSAAPAEETVAAAPESDTDERRHCRRRGGGALPLAAFVTVILAGLVAGKLPAVALMVLCAVFCTSVERAPDAPAAQASGHGSDPR